jgi:uncharacterized BrkB/YihY/UPF0761 family membrane protein
MQISSINLLWFVIIAIICALLGAALFASVTAKNPCRWTYTAIGAIIGLCIAPYMFSMLVMINVENSMIVTEKNQDVQLVL